MKQIRALLLISLLIAGCSNREIEFSTIPPIVRLYYTPLHVIGFMAAHPHLLTYEEEGPNRGWARWELWHKEGIHGHTLHVYKDLFNLNQNVGGGDMWIEAEWSGAEAKRILSVLHRSYEYPHKNEYWFWPGPNSNTFIAWVLNQADIEIDFPWRAWGSSF